MSRVKIRIAAAGFVVAALAVGTAPASMAGENLITARQVSCASLQGDALLAAWHATNSIGGVCVVDGGTLDLQFGFSGFSSICAGDHNSLIRYNLPNDSYLYSSTTERRTCMPFNPANTVKSITRS